MQSRDTAVTTHPSTLVRVENGVSIQLLPKKLLLALTDILRLDTYDSIQPINIDNDDDYRIHFIKRINAIHDGITFLLSCQELHQYAYADQLQRHLLDIKNKCITHIKLLPTDNLTHMQTCLSLYLEEVVKELSRALNKTRHDLLEELSLSEELTLAQKTKQSICTIIRLPGQTNGFAVTLDQPLNPFSNPDLVKELHTIQSLKWPIESDMSQPVWFKELKPYQKLLLLHFLHQVNIDRDFGHIINALSSKLRLIPAPSNFGVHTLITCIETNTGFNITIHPSILRSAHSASRDVSHLSEETRSTHTIRNIQAQLTAIYSHVNSALTVETKKFIYIPILYQTLITPLIEPDKSLENDKLAAMTTIRRQLEREPNGNLKYDLFQTNHALNYGKYLNPTSPNSYSGLESQSLIDNIEKAKEYLSPTANLALLNVAIPLLQEALANKGYFSSYRELYLAGLEQIVVLAAGGYTMGSCVSGKDRKAILTALVDAMQVYFQVTGSLPPMAASTPEQERELACFADIFAVFYCSKHQQALAAQNAPGCFGTKTPRMYLPDFLILGIHRHLNSHLPTNRQETITLKETEEYLDHSDQLATNNDLEKIKPMPIHKNEKNLVWLPPKEQHIAIMDINDFTKLLSGTIQHIKDTYLKTRASTLSFLAKQFDPDSGRFRATIYLELLEDKQFDNKIQLLLIYSLLNDPHGKQLKHTVAQGLGFKEVSTALSSIHYLARHHFTDDLLRKYSEFLSQQTNYILDATCLGPCIHIIKSALTPLQANHGNVKKDSVKQNTF